VSFQQSPCQYHSNSLPVSIIPTVFLFLPFQQFSCQYHSNSLPVSIFPTVSLSVSFQQFSFSIIPTVSHIL
jgi:hypothetical protein